MKKISLLIMLVLSFSSFAAPIKTIRFAIEATYPPFEYMDGLGQIKGFDVDIAKALCLQLKAQCTFTHQSFNSLVPGLKIGKFDALISALGITQERQRQVAFTQSYYEPSASFVAPLQKHYKLTDVLGKNVGVQQGSTFETYLRDNYAGKVIIKSYGSIEDAFLDLLSGRVDMVIADTPIAQSWLNDKKNKEKFSTIEKPIVNAAYFGSGYGIAVRKEDVPLLTSLNQALTEIKKNGQYKKIIELYFGKK